MTGAGAVFRVRVRLKRWLVGLSGVRRGQGAEV